MTTEDLAKRAVACKHWRWVPGMSTDGMLVVDADETGISIVRKETIQDHWAPEDALPDLTDPATLGCLLALVREAWAPATWITTTACLTSGGVHGWRVQGLDLPMQSTEAEALVAALEDAP